jgi:thiamine biosynthesis protein ThiS
VSITVNGDSHELTQPITVAELLDRLAIDPRRVAVEHNLEIVRCALRAAEPHATTPLYSDVSAAVGVRYPLRDRTLASTSPKANL